MSDQPPDEPFDPYRPPPPGAAPPPGSSPSYGSQPYGSQPPSGPPQFGQYPTNYYQGAPPGGPAYQRPSSRPLWLGTLAGLILTGLLAWVGIQQPDLGGWAMGALAVLTIVLLVVPATRRWGLGLLIGFALSIPLGLIIFAGLCIVLIASSGGGA